MIFIESGIDKRKTTMEHQDPARNLTRPPLTLTDSGKKTISQCEHASKRIDNEVERVGVQPTCTAAKDSAALRTLAHKISYKPMRERLPQNVFTQSIH